MIMYIVANSFDSPEINPLEGGDALKSLILPAENKIVNSCSKLSTIYFSILHRKRHERVKKI
jgi:hypothetical protein